MSVTITENTNTVVEGDHSVAVVTEPRVSVVEVNDGDRLVVTERQTDVVTIADRPAGPVLVIKEPESTVIEVGVVGPQGRTGEDGAPGGAGFVFDQAIPATDWVISHPLGYQPAVTIIDSTGEVVEGAIEYVAADLVIARFSAAFSGQAFLS